MKCTSLPLRAARVHHAARRRGGGVAARGARAAGRAGAAHRRAHDAPPRTIRKRRPASRRSCRGCSNWAGPTAATCGSTTRWAAGNADDIRRYAAELVALAPDVILASGASAVAPLLQATRTVPIVFVQCRRSGRRRLRREPGAAGRQRHRLHPVRIQLEREMAGAAQGDRAGRDASGGPSGSRHHRRDRPVRRQSSRVAPSLGVEVSPVNVRDAGEIERAVTAFARSPNGGLIVTASALAIVHRELIVALAARHKLPAVYSRPLLRRRRRPDLLWA